jgi:transcriptional regulator with XRE-family HTH domain
VEPTALSDLLQSVVEPRRKAQQLSLRRAAARAGMSEATWRQLVRGGVTTQGQWVPRVPRRMQVLTMAASVDEETFEHMVGALDATADEQKTARARVHIPDPAEEEILASRHLLPDEKLRLVEVLRSLRRGRSDGQVGREEPGGDGRSPSAHPSETV